MLWLLSMQSGSGLYGAYMLVPDWIFKKDRVFQSVVKFNSIWFLLQGSSGITVKKTGQALVFGIYDEPLTPGQCNIIVERLGDYLIDQGL